MKIPKAVECFFLTSRSPRAASEGCHDQRQTVQTQWGEVNAFAILLQTSSGEQISGCLYESKVNLDDMDHIPASQSPEVNGLPDGCRLMNLSRSRIEHEACPITASPDLSGTATAVRLMPQVSMAMSMVETQRSADGSRSSGPVLYALQPFDAIVRLWSTDGEQ
nr:hypothetical protein CFP56_71896 [Quercus suber]